MQLTVIFAINAAKVDYVLHCFQIGNFKTIINILD